MANEAKRQHFIPQELMRGFASYTGKNHTFVHEFDSKGRHFEKPVKGVGFETYMYGRESDLGLERGLKHEIEDPFNKHLRYIKENGELPSTALEPMFRYLANL